MRCFPLLVLPALLAAEPAAPFLKFVQSRAAILRESDSVPTTRAAWEANRVALRGKLIAAWGGFPETHCELDVQKHGELVREGYAVEKLSFQTLPGIRMTANAYVPTRKGKLPTLLMVHGHWKGAKQDPTVQARCIGAAKLGFFVLCVDAFGAGERGIQPALGEYHGAMTGATLLPIGKPLSGLQVYENRRAVDYLLTRPEVDGERIGITGASGGGNQTMYAAAMDDRLKAAVPVCSVGNYQAYLGAACCMCEVVPGALSFTEEAGLLALVAPRALMVVNATKDAPQFSVDAAKVSLRGATPIFKLYGAEQNLRHAIFESPHDYNKAMREAMYGWMTLHLKGEGTGEPIPEPQMTTEKPEELRCFPGTTRPKEFVTIPRFAAAEGQKLLAKIPQPQTAEEWSRVGDIRRSTLDKLLTGSHQATPAELTPTEDQQLSFVLKPEPGVQLPVQLNRPVGMQPLVLYLHFGETSSPIAKALASGPMTVAMLELRATGSNSVPGDRIGTAPDHNSAEWSMWIGQPLLGQWTSDVRQLLNAVKKLPQEVIVVGEGPAGLVALTATALEPRITKVTAIDSLASYITDEPYVGQRLGLLVPGIVREVGDVAQIAALAAPRSVMIVGGVRGNGQKLSQTELQRIYQPATTTWALLQAQNRFRIMETMTPTKLMENLK